MVVEAEVEKLKRFQEFLRQEDKTIFEEMLDQCKLLASAASVMASPIKQIPLIVSILFAHQKKLTELEKRLEAHDL
jgi:5,10-methenyltetrahydromethanopterin hydrogenase